MRRGLTCLFAVGFALACLAGRAQAQDGKVQTVGENGLKITGTVAATDDTVLAIVGEKMGRLPAKMYRVKMKGGTKYVLNMKSDDIDSFLVVQDVGGKQLAFDDDSGGGANGFDSKLEFTAPKSGTYKVFAAALQKTGKFTLTINQVGGGQIVKGKAYHVGSDGLKIAGELSADDKRVEVGDMNKKARLPAKMYSVKLTGGAKYRLEMKSPTLDSFLLIQNQDGKALAQDDDSGAGANGLDALLDFTAPSSGIYKVFAASNAKETKPGKFVLTVRWVGGTKEEVKQPGDAVREIGKDGLTLEGNIEATDKRVLVRPNPNSDRTFPKAAKMYRVKMKGGEKYRLAMVSKDLDSVLVIQDAAGKQLAFNDDSNDSLNAALEFEAPMTATYKVFAAAFKGTGKFTLTIRPSQGKEDVKKEEGKVHEIGKDALTLKGKLDADNPNRVYQVKLQQGKTYVIDMTSADPKVLDPYLRLLDAKGAKVAENDDISKGNFNARITFRPPTSGTYRIVAMSYLNLGRGPFTIQARAKD